MNKVTLFKCDVCECSYTNKQNLNRHKKTKHKVLPVKTSFYCKICDFTARDSFNLNKHIQSEACQRNCILMNGIPEEPKLFRHKKEAIKFKNEIAQAKKLQLEANVYYYNDDLSDKEGKEYHLIWERQNNFRIVFKNYKSYSKIANYFHMYCYSKYWTLRRHIDRYIQIWKKNSGWKPEPLIKPVENTIVTDSVHPDNLKYYSKIKLKNNTYWYYDEELLSTSKYVYDSSGKSIGTYNIYWIELYPNYHVDKIEIETHKGTYISNYQKHWSGLKWLLTGDIYLHKDM